ncbi:MAG TPA: AIR synthase-related protein, partial [Candidatus Binatia bacterium]|nr:AIR synthase-related protein [Candidatus Binatia bacterium]
LNELAEASQLGFTVNSGKITFANGILRLREHFRLSDEQLLAMSSTGTILAAVKSGGQEKVKAALKKSGLSACFLGEFTENKARVLVRHGKETTFPQTAEDPYSLIMSGK